MYACRRAGRQGGARQGARPGTKVEGMSRSPWLVVALALAVAGCKKEPKAFAPQPPVELGGGLVVQTLREGDGAGAKKSDKVSIHFVGTLEDGGVFDSSRARGQPFAFWVGEEQVVPGLDRGLAGMKEGEVRLITVPPALGYGREGKPTIPPGSTLRFEVELLDIR